MKGKGSSEGRRSEIELSTLPEVAALATELTTLFKDLGITQQQYAIRTNFDKSYISRFLNGRRVASIEFIERLLCEVERHRGVRVTEETRNRLSDLRSRALRAYDPELHKLESLRYEVDKSQRDIKRLMLHQEALELLLKQREAESQSLQRELLQLQSDWMADRITHEAAELVAEGEKRRFEDEREELMREIDRLKNELKVTIAQRNRAEERCADLETQVTAVERHMADVLESEGIDEIGPPIECVQERIRSLAQSSRSAVYRELAECVSSRASRDIAQLCLWLNQELGYEFSEQLMLDYCRQHPVARVAQLVLDIEGLDFNGRREKFSGTPISGEITRREFDELLEFCRTVASGRRLQQTRQRFIDITGVASNWMVRYLGRRSGPRSHFLIPLVDELSRMGEAESVPGLIQRVAQRGITALDYLQNIAEAGRWDIAEVFVPAFVGKAGPRSLARTADHFFSTSDHIAELLIESIHASYDVDKLISLLVDAQKSGYSYRVFNDRLTREAINWYGEFHLKDAISRYNVIVVGGDDEGQEQFDSARAAVYSAIERNGIF
ncbi:helix-turn-helix domain-containing protein [Streptomyces longwoodensis]|uniref:helix-turn-helix domain-containing protein n=1 Tax=Streptomyces longwoodensis TaxID=68231 RepID=UPI00324692EB